MTDIGDKDTEFSKVEQKYAMYHSLIFRGVIYLREREVVPIMSQRPISNSGE